MYGVEFYPTPDDVIRKMLEGVDFDKIESVLEPSAGDGRIVEQVVKKFQSRNSCSYKRSMDIDCIEIDENLRQILRYKFSEDRVNDLHKKMKQLDSMNGELNQEQHDLRDKLYQEKNQVEFKGVRIVHDDFLTYHTYKTYDLIIMNPPFSNGDKHLLKALEMQERSGGGIICLLNAETIKNVNSNYRKVLKDKLDEYNAEIKFFQDAFVNADRETNVEIAMVKIIMPKSTNESFIIQGLTKGKVYLDASQQEQSYLAENDFIKSIVTQYSMEVRAGVELIKEYNAMTPYILSKFSEGGSIGNPILSLTINGRDGTVNEFVKAVRRKYWGAIFMNPKFVGDLTSNLRQRYYDKVGELENYDFSVYNINQIRAEMNVHRVKGIEDTILNLFEEFTYKHHWRSSEYQKNIHYFNGWATNEAWFINKKVIIPLNAYSTWNGHFEPSYTAIEKLSDITKCLRFLDIGKSDDLDVDKELKFAENHDITKNIELKYFNVTFYKKGTCHIVFTDTDLLDRFNIFAARKRGWLPPSYGKKKYTDMSKEEKTVVDDFQGQQAYEKVMNCPEMYIIDSTQLLQLASV